VLSLLERSLPPADAPDASKRGPTSSAAWLGGGVLRLHDKPR